MAANHVRTYARTISGLRVAFGAAGLVAPTWTTRRAAGLDGGDAAADRAWARLWAGREVVLGLVTLEAVRRRDDLDGVLAINALADGIDAVVLGRYALRPPRLGRLAWVGAPVAAAVSVGWVVIRRQASGKV